MRTRRRGRNGYDNWKEEEDRAMRTARRGKTGLLKLEGRGRKGYENGNEGKDRAMRIVRGKTRLW